MYRSFFFLSSLVLIASFQIFIFKSFVFSPYGRANVSFLFSLSFDPFTILLPKSLFCKNLIHFWKNAFTTFLLCKYFVCANSKTDSKKEKETWFSFTPTTQTQNMQGISNWTFDKRYKSRKISSDRINNLIIVPKSVKFNFEHIILVRLKGILKWVKLSYYRPI